ncbi:E3 ubiquitin-protein ligase TM129-like [Pecten maximus]|uniref:E3 ubiquitin-protein ligase TM129-like n=1 Tax=Pecten maximus TaxID=6579 RepID=UPI0014581F66|nr:E3 ubiquitin-protein ligase TM129-like [Pecten maximus]
MTQATVDVLFTIFYVFFSFCLMSPPTEFVSAGITIQNVLSNYLGSEDMHFIYYHIKRTTFTVVVHSFLPLGYYVGSGLFSPEKDLFNLWSLSFFWRMYLGLSISVILLVSLVAFNWSLQKWNNHPISKQLGHLQRSGESWRTVASSINIEFRRFDKFTTGPHGQRVIVTDSWVIKTGAYFLNIAHQNDIHLTISNSEEHSLSYENMSSVQFINFSVSSVNPKVKPFTIRLNSLEYRDLKDKLQAPVRNARDVVIQQSLSDKFLDAFKQQITDNVDFHPPPTLEIETCIGCMQKQADVKLVKLCDNPTQGDCVQCFCRPMWCLECLGKWFASRQDQQHPETWMGSKSPCPTCRATFCVLDVCRIVST